MFFSSFFVSKLKETGLDRFSEYEATGQVGGIVGMIFRVSLARGCGVCFSLESPHRGDSAEYRQYNFSKIHSKLSLICKITLDLRRCGFFFRATRE